jgi:Transmembrane secretion effector
LRRFHAHSRSGDASDPRRSTARTPGGSGGRSTPSSSYAGRSRPGLAMRLPVLLDALRHRDFRWFWAGQAVSLIGDGIFNVALVWQTLEISSTPRALATVTLARHGPRLMLLLIGGAVSDRMSRRRLMLTTDLIQGLGVGLIALLSASSSLGLWHLASTPPLSARRTPSTSQPSPQSFPSSCPAMTS